MKKLSLLIFSLIFAFCGVSFAANDFALAEDDSNDIFIRSVTEYLNVMGNTENFSGKNIILKTDLNFEGEENALEALPRGTFTSNFDGNGYTISNYTFYSDSYAYGLLSEAENCTISNVRFNGDLTFMPNDKVYFIGGLVVGIGNNVTIENCEIAPSAKIHTQGSDNLDISAGTTFGGFAGQLNNGSKLINCVSYTNFNFVTDCENIDQTGKKETHAIGGLVGHLYDANISYCLLYPSLTSDNKVISGYEKLEEGMTSVSPLIDVGGIVGQVNGNYAQVYNVASFVAAKSDSTAGNIVGAVLSSTPKTDNINYSYFMGEGEAIGSRGDYELTSEEKFKALTTITNSFILDWQNWNLNAPAWNDRTGWMPLQFYRDSEDKEGVTRLALQRFQTFEFGFASNIGDGNIIDNENELRKPRFEGGNDVAGTALRSYRYGDTVTMVINVVIEKENYYTLSKVMIGNSTPDQSLYAGKDGEGNGAYKITFKANKVTSASNYNFAFTPKLFEYTVESANSTQGGVNKGGTSFEASFKDTIKYSTTPLTIDASGYDIYTFERWELSVWNGTTWQKVENFRQANSHTLQIYFGQTKIPNTNYDNLFTDSFKLVAYFSENAKDVSFGKDANIVKLVFNGQEYDGTPIKVAKSAQSAEIVATCKKGYEIDTDKFLTSIAKMCNLTNTDSVMPSDPYLNEEDELVYRFYINISKLPENNNSVTFSLTSIQSQNDDANSLLWLWILIPVVGVLIIGGIVAFILIRRYRFKHGAGKFGSTNAGASGKAKKVKEKKPDYKDFYY